MHQALAVNGENQTLVQRLRKVAETAYGSGQAPQQDVLQGPSRLYLNEMGTGRLAGIRPAHAPAGGDAHSVSVDPASGLSYFPIRNDGGHPALWVFRPTPCSGRRRDSAEVANKP